MKSAEEQTVLMGFTVCSARVLSAKYKYFCWIQICILFFSSLVCFDTGVHVGTHWKLATSSSAKWMYFHIQIWEDISWQLETAPSFERCDLRSTNKVQSREWERTDFLLFRRIHNWWQDLDFTSEPVFQRGSCSSLELQQCASDYNFTAFFMPETIYLNSKSSLPAFWGKIKTNGWERILNPVKIEMSTHTKLKSIRFIPRPQWCIHIIIYMSTTWTRFFCG